MFWKVFGGVCGWFGMASLEIYSGSGVFYIECFLVGFVVSLHMLESFWCDFDGVLKVFVDLFDFHVAFNFCFSPLFFHLHLCGGGGSATGDG